MLENEMLDKLLENVLESIKRSGEKVTNEILIERLEKYELTEEQTDYITEKLEEMGVQFVDEIGKYLFEAVFQIKFLACAHAETECFIASAVNVVR